MKLLPTMLFTAFSLCFYINSLHELEASLKTEITYPHTFLSEMDSVLQSEPDVKIETNRLDQVITITCKNDIRSIDIEIYNLLGKKVAQGDLILNDKSVQFSILDLSSGVYILVTTTATGKRKSFKFVK